MADESIQLKTLQTILIIFQSRLLPDDEVKRSSSFFITYINSPLNFILYSLLVKYFCDEIELVTANFLMSNICDEAHILRILMNLPAYRISVF